MKPNANQNMSRRSPSFRHASLGWLLLIALLLAPRAALEAAEALAAKPEAGSQAETNKKLVWRFTPNPALPNVLILGDSISMGYTLHVREHLAGKANVFRPMSVDGKTAVNCEGTTLGLQQIDLWLAGRQWSVIHFNWGLHDLKHVKMAGTAENSTNPADPCQATVDEYRRNLETLVRKLKATGARLIFATTTPVPEGNGGALREVNAPARYNAAALEIMKAKDIRVNDLYSFCEPQLSRLQLPKNVHFKPAGSEALALQVATAIEGTLTTRAPALPR
jgi:acyl-CoA thioesterase-1